MTISCCLWTFPISDKNPDLMEILGYTPTETLLWDYSETEEYYVLAKPPARKVNTLYHITLVYAWHWFRINNGSNLRTVYYPFVRLFLKNLTDPCNCPPEPIDGIIEPPLPSCPDPGPGFATIVNADNACLLNADDNCITAVT